ncbi:MAG: glycosyltransferase, partial [Acidimicrobiales bacterium]
MTSLPPAATPPPPTFSAADFDAATLAAGRQGRTVTLCLPARDEAATVGDIVAAVQRHLRGCHGLVDEIVVVDDSSTDGTAAAARRAGARVVRGPGLGKGEAMQAGLAAAEGDLIVFCDADVRSFRPAFVVGLLGPLLAGRAQFVKARY